MPLPGGLLVNRMESGTSAWLGIGLCQLQDLGILSAVRSRAFNGRATSPAPDLRILQAHPASAGGRSCLLWGTRKSARGVQRGAARSLGDCDRRGAASLCHRARLPAAFARGDPGKLLGRRSGVRMRETGYGRAPDVTCASVQSHSSFPGVLLVSELGEFWSSWWVRASPALDKYNEDRFVQHLVQFCRNSVTYG